MHLEHGFAFCGQAEDAQEAAEEETTEEDNMEQSSVECINACGRFAAAGYTQGLGQVLLIFFGVLEALLR